MLKISQVSVIGAAFITESMSVWAESKLPEGGTWNFGSQKVNMAIFDLFTPNLINPAPIKNTNADSDYGIKDNLFAFNNDTKLASMEDFDVFFWRLIPVDTYSFDAG